MANWPLPPELTLHIFDLLDRHAACAAVSRQWQRLAEVYTFSVLKITGDRIRHFDRIVQGGRRKYLRHVIVAPGSDKKDLNAVPETLHSLLRYLGQWNETDMGPREGMCLILCGDWIAMSGPDVSSPGVSGPPVSVVGTLKIGCISQKYAKKASVLEASTETLVAELMSLVSRLPRLHSFSVRSFHTTFHTWFEMLDALSSLPNSLRKILLSASNTYKHPNEKYNHCPIIPTHFARFTQQLSHLWYEGIAWESFFQNPIGTNLHWPHMERLIFYYHPGAEPPVAADEDVSGFAFKEYKPITRYGVLNPMYVKAAKAAAHMPRLRHFCVCACRLFPSPTYSHYILYEVINGRGLLSWAEAETYDPSPEVIELWKAVSLSHTRQELIIQGARDYPQSIDSQRPW